MEQSLKKFLEEPKATHHPTPLPAYTTSINGFGCILFFLKDLKDFTEKRNDIRDLEAYQKNGVFEEICHLVEQKGDSSLNPRSYWMLLELYKRRNRLELGNQIIETLDRDRNHYEVYLMMIEAYPKEWVDRYWRYFMPETPDYEQMKQNVPTEIAYARLITDTLRSINVLYVAKKVPEEKLSDEQKKFLDILIETGKREVEKRKSMIEKDVGVGALSLIDSLDESVFKTPDVFFSVILDLWKSLHLV